MKSLYTSVKTISRVALCLLLCGILLCGALTVSAAPTTKGSAQDLGQSGTVQGHLDGIGTANWYKITPNAAQYYRFTFYNQSVETRLGVSIADSLLNLFLGKMSIVIYDSYDAILAEGDVKCGYTGSVSLRLEQGQTYYVKLNSTVAGNYRLTTANFADIGANAWSGAEDMLSNGRLISSIDADGDTDWFRFVADEEQSYYRFSLENISGSGNQYLYLYEYVAGAGETPLRDVWNISVRKGNTGSKDVQLKEGHTYYYRISGSTGGYQLNVSQTLDVAGPDFETAYAIETDTKYTTSFNGEGDADCFAFTTGQEDAYYHFETELLFSTNGYVTFRLYDEAGNEVGEDRTHSSYFPNQLNYRLTPNTTYYFRLSKETATIGNYEVTVRKVEDAHPNKREQAVTVAVDKTIQASFDGTGDVDYFRFITGDAQAYYRFETELLFSTNGYVTFRLYDGAGNKVGEDRTHSGYFPRKVDYLLEPNATYYFRFNKESDDVGNYTTRIVTLADREGNTQSDAYALKLNSPYTTDLAIEDDVDWFAFAVDYDGDYRLRLNNETGGNISAYLYNEYEKEIKSLSISSNYNEVVSLTAGKYYIKVQRRYGSTKYYTLAMAECGGGHEGKSVYATKATTDRDGVKRTVCKYCGAVMKTEKVARLSTVKLTKTTWSCTGKTLTPTIKVTDADGKTVSSSYYTLTTSATGKTPGKYTLTVTFKGKYSGTKKLTYTVALATPKVTAKGDGSSIKVTWNKVPAATTYVVYRRQYVSGKWSGWTKVKTTTSTSYTHSGPTAGRYYRYAVKAYRGSAVSEMGSSVSAVKLAKPTSVKASGKTAGITVSWKKVSGAKGYYVYARKQSGSKWGSWSKIKVTTATSYTHKTASYGANYQYRVCAYYEDSVSAYGTTVSAIRLKAPTGVKSAKSGSAIKTSWKKVTGASGYVVYRRTYNAKTGKYGSWVKIKTTTSLSYTDKSAKKGTYYQYAVTAYKSSHVSDRKSGSKVKR